MSHRTTVNYESVASRAIKDIAKVTELLGVPEEEAGRPIVELVKEYLAAQSRNSVPNEQGKNRYGLDMAYFRNLFNRELNRPLVDFRPDELARVLARAARTADASVLQEPEFQSARAQGGQGAEPVAEIVHDYNGISVQWLEPAKYGRFQSGQKLYTQPQPAMPEGWRVIRMPEFQKALMTGPIIGLDGPRGESVPVVSDSDDRRERHLYQFLDALLSTPTTPQPEVESFQSRVAPWMQECFGPEVSADKVERNHRFLEESLELVQSLGCTKAEALQLVDYVYGRPAGDPPQEVGGVRVTLAALCLAAGMDQDECAETELARIWTKVPQIRAKQAAKPKHSPLPQADGCPECGSTDLSWHTQSSVTNGTPDGKLRANEVSTLFVLGCGHCSETIKTLTADQVAENMSPQPPTGQEGV